MNHYKINKTGGGFVLWQLVRSYSGVLAGNPVRSSNNESELHAYAKEQGWILEQSK